MSCEGPLGKTSLFDVEALTNVDPATKLRADGFAPKVCNILLCLVCGFHKMLTLGIHISMYRSTLPKLRSK